MKTTLETSEDDNYTQNEWRWKLHSKRVRMKTTLETSEDCLGCCDYMMCFFKSLFNKNGHKFKADESIRELSYELRSATTLVLSVVLIHSFWVYF